RHPFWGEDRGIERNPAASRRADQPSRAVSDAIEHSEQVFHVQERPKARRGLAESPAVVCHHGHPGCQAASHLLPASPVGHPLMQKHDDRGTTQPALSGEIDAVPGNNEPFAHDQPSLSLNLAGATPSQSGLTPALGDRLRKLRDMHGMISGGMMRAHAESPGSTVASSKLLMLLKTATPTGGAGPRRSTTRSMSLTALSRTDRSAPDPCG